jgi:3-hydroxyacyl-[acyl-carrier-protein] dehydratase|tara:strand:+ start:110 stop:592 length:483 start_codon:yes stop_codon:yes gene_type:complete
MNTKTEELEMNRFPRTTLNVLEIMELIPHRPPFLMIDKVVEMVQRESAVGIKNVSIDEPFFIGHFPKRPVLPGVLIIESMAQTAGVLVVESLGKEARGKLVYFMTIESARFRKPVFPGDQVRLEVTKLRSRGPVWKFSGKALVESVMVAEAVYSAMIMDD